VALNYIALMLGVVDKASKMDVFAEGPAVLHLMMENLGSLTAYEMRENFEEVAEVYFDWALYTMHEATKFGLDTSGERLGKDGGGGLHEDMKEDLRQLKANVKSRRAKRAKGGAAELPPPASPAPSPTPAGPSTGAGGASPAYCGRFAAGKWHRRTRSHHERQGASRNVYDAPESKRRGVRVGKRKRKRKRK
jgi:hypothetical protein